MWKDPKSILCHHGPGRRFITRSISVKPPKRATFRLSPSVLRVSFQIHSCASIPGARLTVSGLVAEVGYLEPHTVQCEGFCSVITLFTPNMSLQQYGNSCSRLNVPAPCSTLQQLLLKSNSDWDWGFSLVLQSVSSSDITYARIGRCELAHSKWVRGGKEIPPAFLSGDGQSPEQLVQRSKLYMQLFQERTIHMI